MDNDLYFQIVIFLICLILSAFFSSAETAFFSLTKVDRNRLKDKNTQRSKRVLALLSKPRNLLITILTGNTIVNVAAAAIAALIASELSYLTNSSEELAIFVEVIVVTFVILILSEITPKVFAVKNSIWLTELVALPIQIVSTLLFPITLLLSQFPITLSKIVKSRSDKYLLSKDELKTLIYVGKEKGAIIEEERKMIDSIFEFTDTSVKEIMVPRTDIICVDKEISFTELLNVIKDKGHTRIPVYDERVDNIIGILHAKELLPFIQNKAKDVDLQSIVRPALFIPESQMIDELLKNFQKQKMHMAIIVDEYGGTAGLITLEDIIEEIVGEIQDEYDAEIPLYRKLDDGTILTAAKIGLDDLNEELKLNLPTDINYESLGGFILNITGSLPKVKDEILYEGYKFIIEKVEKNRIVQVSIHKIKNE